MSFIFARTRAWAANSETVRNWRERRYTFFMKACAVEPGERILDVGAGRGEALERFNTTNPIVALDIEIVSSPWLGGPNVTVVQGDGTQLAFTDGEFPVVFSNSVLSSVPKDQQPALASEISRVGQRYFVQVPYRYFPIDPYYQLPFFQLLPARARRFLAQRLSLGWRSKEHWSETTLFTVNQLQRLFPDSHIHRERLFGLTKSLMAVRGRT